MIQHIPLLQIQRDLHDIPRGMERFRAYLKTMTNEEGDDLALPPLGAMNPMGREHVSARLDELLALNAEQIAEDAVAEASTRLSLTEREMKHGMVIMDDVRGGWTNRYVCEFGSCSLPDRIIRNQRSTWISTALWVSDTPSPALIRQSVLRSVFLALYALERGECHTLRDMLSQEGEAGRFAGVQPHLEEEDIEYTLAVLEPLLDSTNYATCFVAMLGDVAAEMLGYPKLGLSERAGFALAIAYTFDKDGSSHRHRALNAFKNSPPKP